MAGHTTRPIRRSPLRALRESGAGTTAALVTAIAIALDSPALILAVASPAQVPQPAQQQPVQEPPPGLVGAQPLPPEAIRRANLELEAALKKESTLIEGERVGRDGGEVSWAVEGGLLLTRDLWVALLQYRAAALARLKVMSREEKLALIDKLRAAAPALRDAYLNMNAAEGAALDPYRHERAAYEGLIRDAESDEQAAKNPALTEEQRAALLARAAERRDRAERSPWKFYADRRATFFGLLEANPENALLGLYEDNWIMPNRYLFQTLMHTSFSLDPTERGDELIEIFDGYLDVSSARMEKLAMDAEEIDDFEDLLEFLNPKYAQIHQLARAITRPTGMTFPALSVEPFTDLGRSYELAEVFSSTLYDILITIVCVGTMVIPIVGAIVNTGVAVFELTYEGGSYAVQWSRENDARLTASVTGQQHVITEDERTSAQGGRAVMAVIQAATELPFVRGTVREAQAARALRARLNARFGPDIDLSATPGVQRGARRARELGIPQSAIDQFLKHARTIDYETAAQRVRARGIQDNADEFANEVEKELTNSWRAARPFAATLAQFDRLDDMAAAARAAGVPDAEIDALFDAARKSGNLLEVSRELPQRLLSATISQRNITLVIDTPYPRKIETGPGFEEVADYPAFSYRQFWTHAKPPPVLRGDMTTLVGLRERLSMMGRGGVVTMTSDEVKLLGEFVNRPDVHRLFAYVSDENVFVRLFEDDQLQTARNFFGHPNRDAIANGQAVLPLTRRLTIVDPPPLDPVVDPFSRWMLTGAVATNALLRLSQRDDGSVALESGLNPFSTASLSGDRSAISAPALRSRFITGTPTAGDLEDWAVDRARSRFGDITNWSTSILPDGRVAVTSPDSMRRVTVSLTPTSEDQSRIDFMIEQRRDRFIDHEYTTDVTLRFALPTGGTTLSDLGVAPRPARVSAPPANAPTPDAGTPGASPGGTTATPQQASALPAPVNLGPNQAFAAASPGTVAPVGGENVWTPTAAVTTAPADFTAVAAPRAEPPATPPPPDAIPGPPTPPAAGSRPLGPSPTPATPGTPTSDAKNIKYETPIYAGYGWDKSDKQTLTLRLGARFEAGNDKRGASLEAGNDTVAALGFLLAGGLMTTEEGEKYLRDNPGVRKALQNFSDVLQAAAINSAEPDDVPQDQATLTWTDDTPIVVAANASPAPSLPWAQGGLWAMLRESLGLTRAAGPYASRGLRPPERWIAPSHLAQQPAGAQRQAERPSVKLFFTSLGRSSGESVRMTVVNDGNVPVRIALGAVALEPLEKLTERDVQRELKKLAGKSQVTVNVEAYCLNLRKPPPAAGMVMRLADANMQARVAPLARIGDAARRLYEQGALNREGDSKKYVQSLLQWVLWTQEQKFDEPGFRRAFVEHAQKNIAGAGRKWTRELERAVTALTPQRWTDIQSILREAGMPRR